MCAHVTHAARQQFATFTLEAVCGAAPVAPDRKLTTAGALLGGLNVAWSGLGGQPGGDDPSRLAPLFDGIVAPSTGYHGDIGSTVTVIFHLDPACACRRRAAQPIRQHTAARHAARFCGGDFA